ncbi:MAG: hypothetical protein KKH98_09080 [Spirochaetes bacterium]|nr:hypothetical protein [Spirochaetota bacterium]
MADDASAPFYNTAGTAFLHQSELTFQNIFFKKKLNSFNYISFNQIMGEYGTLSIGGIKGSFTDSFGNINYLNCGYGKQLFWFLTAGINIKYFNQIALGKNIDQADMDLSIYFNPTINQKKEIRELLDKTENYIRKKSDSSLELGRKVFHKKKYVEAINLFQESLKYDPNNDDAREYLLECGRITGINIQLPPKVNIRSESFKGNFTLKERKLLAEKEYQKGLEHYYNENYILALKSWQKALDILYVNNTVDRMKMGVSVNNLFKHTYIDDSSKLRSLIKLNFGIVYEISQSLRLITEAYKFEGNNNPLGLDLGTEIDVLSFCSLRGGMEFGQPITLQNKNNRFTAGIGFYFNNYSFDYAYLPNDPLYHHSISVSIKFGMSREEEAVNLLNDGILYAKSGKIDEAEEKWKKALLLDPSQNMARKYLNGEVGVARSLTKKSDEELSRNSFNKGLESFKKDDYLNARLHFSEALIIHPQNNDARSYLERTREKVSRITTDAFIKGNDQMAKKDWKNAVLSFKTILQYDYQNEEAKALYEKSRANLREQMRAYLDEAELRYNRKEYLNALENVQFFLTFDPEDKEGRALKYKIDNALEKERMLAECGSKQDKADTLVSNGKYKEALELYLQVKADCPDFKDNDRKISIVTEKKQEEEKLQENLREADNYFRDGLKEYEQQNYESAGKYFKRAVELNPGLVKAQLYIKESENRIFLNLKKEEQVEKAKELFNESLRLIQEEKYSTALEKLEVASTLDEGNELIKNKISDVRDIINLKIEKPYQDGIRYYNEGRLSLAIENWNYVLKIQPEHTLAKTYLEKAIGQKDESVKLHNKLGKDFLKKKNYSGAIKEFREVLALDPGNETAEEGVEKASEVLRSRIDAFYKKGEALFNENKFINARKEFINILELDPGYLSAIEYKKRCDEKIISRDKDSEVQLRLDKGKEYLKNRFFDAAIVEFNKALRIEPGNETAKKLLDECNDNIRNQKNRDKISDLFNKVALHYREEDYKNALDVLQQIIKIDPDNDLIKKYITITKIKWSNYLETYYTKAKKMEETGDFYSAKTFYLKVYKSDPEYKDIKFILDRFDSKIKDYINISREKAREFNNKKEYLEAYTLWERIYKLLPNDKEAKKYIKIIGSKSGKITEGNNLFSKGVELYRSKKWMEALIYFNRSIDLNSTLKSAFEQKYKTSVEENLKPELNRILNSGIKDYEKNDYLKALDNLNIVYQMAPENQRARKYYNNVIQKLDSLSQDHLARSKNHLKSNELKNAYDQIKLALEYSPHSEEIRGLLLEIEDKYSKKDKIKDQQNKGNVDALLFEGIRLYRAGDLEKAIVKWKQVIAMDPGNRKVKNYITRAQTKLTRLGQ